MRHLSFILNATTECPNVFSGQGIEYMRCALVDDVTTEIIPQFEGAIQFIGVLVIIIIGYLLIFLSLFFF